jgi:hypothetical protein
MNNVKQFKFADKTINYSQMAAPNQKELLLHIGGGLTVAANSAQEVVNDVMLSAYLIRLPSNVFDQVCDLALSSCVMVGMESVPVTLKDFQGRMMDLIGLIVEIVRFNLADFFIWLDSKIVTKAAANTEGQ